LMSAAVIGFQMYLSIVPPLALKAAAKPPALSHPKEKSRATMAARFQCSVRAAYSPPISEGWLQAQPELKPTPYLGYRSSCCDEHMARSSVGMPRPPRYGATAPISLEASGPSMTSTPWFSTSWRAWERAVLGSFWVSA